MLVDAQTRGYRFDESPHVLVANHHSLRQTRAPRGEQNQRRGSRTNGRFRTRLRAERCFPAGISGPGDPETVRFLGHLTGEIAVDDQRLST